MSPDNSGNDAAQSPDPASSEQQIQQQAMLEQMAPMPGMMGMPGMTSELIRQAQMATAGSGPGYEFDSAHVSTIIAKLENVRDKARDAGRRLADAAQNIEAPAADGPSQRQADRTRASLYAAEGHNWRLQDYAQRFIDKLNDAQRSYRDVDETNASSSRQQM